MKKNLIYILFASLAVALAGCDTQDGQEGYYTDPSRVYLPQDSMGYSFGFVPIDQMTATVEIPVWIMGDPSKVSGDMRIKVVVDKDKTTATSDMYEALPAEGFPVSYKDDAVLISYFPISFIRDNIPNENVFYRITLRLEANDDFGIGLQDSREMIFDFNNYLSEPLLTSGNSAWNARVNGGSEGTTYLYLGNYHPTKYLKLLEYIWEFPYVALKYTYPDQALDVMRASTITDIGTALWQLAAKSTYRYFAARQDEYPEFFEAGGQYALPMPEPTWTYD